MNYKNSKFYVENISIGKLTRSFQTLFTVIQNQG